MVFLKSVDDINGPRHSLGYAGAEIHGFSGKEAEPDEYKAADHWRGKLLMRDGMPRAPRVMGHEICDSWRFDKEPQVLNVQESYAIQAIRDQLLAVQLGRDP